LFRGPRLIPKTEPPDLSRESARDNSLKPMSFLDIGLVLAGLGLLIAGGEALVRGAGTLASRAGISPLVIGLVVVSAATSAPELAVTVGAVVSGEPDLAVGNVIGSNIANILLILGISAVVSPLVIKRQLVRFDIPVMLGLSLLLVIVSLDGRISVLNGALLFAALLVHSVLSVRLGRKDVPAAAAPPDTMPLNSKPVSLWLAILLLLLGIGLLVLGAQALVTGAVNIATAIGISSLVIGLTVVAIGTSLPELATSLVALRRGETDMAVGNVVGSNIFNIGMVIGLPAIFFGEGIPVAAAAVSIDLPLMLAAAVALLPIAFTGFIVARWEGALFVLLYVSYTLYLVLASTEHDAAAGFSTIMLWFVLPLVAMTLIAVTSYEFGILKGRKNQKG
jgi:cation:H+ antiporter